MKANVSRPMIALAVITLTLSSYGLYGLAHDFGHVPAFLALLSVAGYDLFAVQAGKHALDLARDGDSAGVWHAMVFATAGLSAGLQYAHSQLANEPIAVGILKAGFPIATVMLFDGTLRRAYRLNGRRTGRVAQPRASFEPLQWLMFPRATIRAFRFGVVDRTLGSDAAFKMALVAAQDTEPDYTPPPRREIDLAYDQLVPGMRQLTTGLHPGSAPGSSGESAGEGPVRQSVSALVRASAQVRGRDREAIVADVAAARPDVQEGTIRREIRKLPTLQVAPDPDSDAADA